MVEIGGKCLYGAPVGILMLDTQFPRVPGDMGNALTWPFPVHYKIVRGASPDQVVRRNAEGLLPDFIAAARELVADGADGITTNCGFLSLFQVELAHAVNVPVVASALMQVPLLQAILPPGQRIGIITISHAALTQEHLKCANVPLDTPIIGTDGGRELSRVILDDEPELNTELARQDMIDAARTLIEEHGDIGAILLECTNMVPYAADLRREFGLPIFSIYTFVTWFQSALVPPAFERRIGDPRPSF
ncbi:MAG: aspartate/glutamate racemase family protein [Alphaproteobacteria bacterium]|nr:aspartate/glutamate racemase family protein [Alphaproteobacteria bacterium]